MPDIRFLLESGAILIAIIVFFSMVISMIRGLPIPQCFYCGALKVRPSRPSGFLDLLAKLVLIRAYRCSGCQARFHAMRLLNRSRTQSIS